MLKNEIITALRNITRHKIHAVINIAGLSMGMAVSVLILFWVWGEVTYDKHHIHAERIFRTVNTLRGAGIKTQRTAKTPAPYGPNLMQAFDEVEQSVRLYPSRILVRSEKKTAFEDGFFADASLFELFTFPVLQGNPQTALRTPGSVVLTRSAAEKYFGDDPPLNRSLPMENRRTGCRSYTVTAIIADPPERSHFRTDLFISMTTLETIPFYRDKHFESWAHHGMYTYLLLREGVSPAQLEEKLSDFNLQYSRMDSETDAALVVTTHLQPLRRIHLNSHLHEEIRPNGERKNVVIFSIVAFAILLMACINYMNLATAQTITRAKEVGIRKAVGASPRQLVKQFFIEAFVFTLIALVFTILLIELAMPLYHAVTGETLAYAIFTNWTILGTLILLLLFVGFVSGSYPAYILSHSNPASILRGLLSFGMEKLNLRRGLVLFQFCIAIGLITVTLVMYKQVDYLRKNRGFDAENVLVIPIHTKWMKTNHARVKEELYQNPNILSASVAAGVPWAGHAVDDLEITVGDRSVSLAMKMICADHEYLRTLGLGIAAGRGFSTDIPSDASEAFLLNEAAVRELRLSHPLETRIRWEGEWHGIQKQGRVIGIVRDFQYESPSSPIDPLLIRIEPGLARLFLVKIHPEDIPGTLAFLRRTWEKFNPAHPFEYDFLEETVNRRVQTEIDLSRVLAILSILSIVIASLGLLGLTAYLVQQRTKEIGMRKVLGASFLDIVSVLLHEFTKWILLANLIAWPIAFLIARKWLTDFALRIPLGLDNFLLSGITVCLIAFSTICFQASRIAFSNPTDNLRYE